MKETPQAGYTYDLLESTPIVEDTQMEAPQVEFAGFNEVNATQRDAMDKIVSNHLKRLSSRCQRIETIRVTMKGVHGRNQKKVELHGKLVENGKNYTSEVVHHDLLVGLDLALRKLEHAIAK